MKDRIDATTGEITKARKPGKPGKPGQPNGFMEAWASVACAPLVEFAVREKRSTDLRVLLMVMGTVQYGNDLGSDAKGIGAMLGIHRAHVSAAIRRLRDNGILDVASIVSGIPRYKITPTFSWRGSRLSHVIATTAKQKAVAKKAKEAREADNLAKLRVARMRLEAKVAHDAPGKRSATGYRGVSEFRGKFRAQIQRQGKRYTLGTFATAPEASQAYESAVQELSIHKPKV